MSLAVESGLADELANTLSLRRVERRWSARTIQKKDGTTTLSEFVFHRSGKPIIDFRRPWKEACKKARVPGRLFHDLRRTAVRNMIRAGVPQS